MKKILAVLIVLELFTNIAGLSAITIDPHSGVVGEEAIRLELLHFAPGWSASFQSLRSRPVSSGNTETVWRGIMPVVGGTFNVTETVSKTPDSVFLRYDLESEHGIPTRELSLTVILPFSSYRGRAIAVDGRIVQLPELLRVSRLMSGAATSVEIPMHDQVLQLNGDWPISIQLLPSGDGSYHIRFLMASEQGAIRSRHIELRISRRSFVPDELLLPLPPPEKRFEEGEEYAAIEWQPVPVRAGSALDLSGMLDAPAGKYGRVIIRNENFEFENRPGVPLRFWGTNLCSEAAMPPRDEAERLADALAACGYNAVRFHHFDMCISAPGNDRVTNEEAFDRMCYLMNALRKRGIYYTIDLFTQRRLTEEMTGKNLREIIAGTKLLLPVNEVFDANMRRFAKDLLTRVNPYSGIALKDDPALLPFNIINENPLPNNASFFPQYLKLYEAEMTKLHPSTLELSNSEKRRELGWFMLNRQIDYYRSMRIFLHSIGIKQATSDLSMGNQLQLIMPRSALDFVDNHSYFALYEFDASGRVAQAQHSPNVAGFSYPLQTGATRIFGKPFVAGEAQICSFSPFRMQYAPLTAGLGILQGWSGIMHYAYSHSADRIIAAQGAERLNYGNDPLMLLGDRFGALAFLHSSTPTAVVEIPYVVTPEYIKKIASPTGSRSYTAAYWQLGTKVRIGSRLLDRAIPEIQNVPFVVVPGDMAVPEWLKPYQVLRDNSDLSKAVKQMNIPDNTLVKLVDGKSFQLMTDVSEAILSEAPGKINGRHISLESGEAPGVLAAAAIDGNSFANSKRILLLYLTDLKNSGTEIHSEAILVEKGRLPLLIRRSSARIFLQGITAGKPRVYALKYTGERASEVAVTEIESGKYGFTVQAVTTPDTYYAYEIVIE